MPTRPRILAAVTPIFFLSGVSGLLYQIVWVRWFGRVFGNTLYSASIVTAVFMGGLGLGAYLGGGLADRRAERDGDAAPLRLYALAELIIAGLGALLAFLLPALEPLSASISHYVAGPDGWFQLSGGSYALRYLLSLLLLLPVTTVMGATLTLLIRYLLAGDLRESGWRVGVLYGVNTAGAALGAFLSDFLLVPALGLQQTQLLAVVFNLLAAVAALRLVERATAAPIPPVAAPPEEPGGGSPALIWGTGLAIGLSGFAAMGIEILWFRHLSVALGGLRSVFSLLLTVMLLSMWLGSVLGGALQRRFGRAAPFYMAGQAGLVVTTLLLLYLVPTATPPDALRDAIMEASGLRLVAMQSLHNLKTIAALVGPPAILMGLAYPLSNAHIQRVGRAIGRRAGALYLANTAGAVGGSLLTGLVLIPTLGIHRTAAVLGAVAALAIAPLIATLPGRGRSDVWLGGACASAAILALGLWLTLPTDTLLLHGIREDQRLLALSEGPNELVAVTEDPKDGSRRLMTDGYSMSSTTIDGQRYMRAFTHLPLMQMEAPTDVLVICFGVGSTLHSASLHPSLKRIEIADLSRNVLEQNTWFSANNHGVLDDPRVSVFVNDGRQHLRMQPPGRYDLITLEPPPIRNAGVSGLYSEEFYALAASRLKEGGAMAQWLPAYQVPEDVVRSMVKAFVDVFPASVLLSGERKELILLGVKGDRVVFDLPRAQRALASNPALREDLERIHLGTLTELVGTYLASADAMRRATEGVRPVTDDWPIMEYSAYARAQTTRFPADLVEPWTVQGWCPSCFVDGAPVPAVAELGDYLRVLNAYYTSDAFLVTRSYQKRPGGFYLPADVDVARLAAGGSYLRTYFGLGQGAAAP